MKTRSRRGWLVPGAVLLLLFALCMLLRQERKAGGGGAVAVARDTPAPLIPPIESAADKARRAAIATQGPVKHKGVNAADLYKEAIGLYADLTEDEKNMLQDWRNKPDPKIAPALYTKIQPIMDLLRAARKADYVDWGMGTMRLEDVAAESAKSKLERNLAVLASWEAAYRFQSDPDGAVGDVAAMDAMGRSIDDSIIGFVMDSSIHSMGMWVIAQNGGGISSAAGPDLTYIVNPAAKERSFEDGMNGEAAMLQAELDEYANPATRSESYIWKCTSGGSITSEEMVSEQEWMMQTEQAIGTTLMEPDAQFQQWWTQKVAESASMPVPIMSQLANQVLPVLADVRNGARAAIVQNVMLEAGLALEQGSRVQFQSILDPSTSQPFTYIQTVTGFQLGSALQNHGKPLTLNFSTPSAK